MQFTDIYWGSRGLCCCLLSVTTSLRQQADFRWSGSHSQVLLESEVMALLWSYTVFLSLKPLCCLFVYMLVLISHPNLLHWNVSSTLKQTVLLLPFSAQFVVSSLHEAAATLGSAKLSALYHCWKVQLWFHHTTEYFASQSPTFVFNIQARSFTVMCLVFSMSAFLLAPLPCGPDL